MHVLRFLGEVSVGVSTGSSRRHLTQSRSIALLALLAASDRRGLTRDKLVGLLWEEIGTGPAKHSLSNQIHLVRRDLGSNALLTTGEFVSINPDFVSADVADFGAAVRDGDLERAAALYAGPFLDGFHLSAAGEFERWLDHERRHLATQALGVFEALAAQAHGAGNQRQAVEWWQRAVQHDPYNSRATVDLARALAASGDPGNGVQLLKEHVRRLNDDLGIEPDPGIQRMIETGDFGLSPTEVAAAKSTSGRALATPGQLAELSDADGSSEATTAVEIPSSRIGPLGTARVFRYGLASALVLILVAVTSNLVSRLRGVEEYNPDLVAILPIQPVGVDSVVAALVTSQIHSSLADWNMPQAADPEQTRRWLRRVRTSPDGDLPEHVAANVGERLGAGRALAGEVTPSGEGVEVHAAILSVPDGVVLASSRASGSMDSLSAVVESLLNRLLAEEQGVFGDRIATFDAYESAAVRSYVEARRLGADARDRLLREAIDHDSTFALAALELHASLPDYYGLNRGGAWEEVASVAWKYRNKLSPADRTYAEALLGWRFNPEHSAALQVEAWRRAVEVAPDRLAHWRGLALECYRWCSEIQRIWREPVLEILDSLFVRGDFSLLEQGLETALLEGDRRRLQSYGALLPPDAWYGSWLVALGTDRGQQRADLVEQIDESGGWGMRFGSTAILTGLGLEDAEKAAAVQGSNSAGSIYSLEQMVLARERGRHSEYRRLRDRLFQFFHATGSADALHAANLTVEWAYFGEPETEAILDALDTAFSALVSGVPVISPDTLAVAHCFRAQLRLVRRDTTGIRDALRYLTSDSAVRSLAISRICAPFLELLWSRGQSRDFHADAARRLNDVMRERPLDMGFGLGMISIESFLATAANLELARSFGALGYPESGLEAAGRRPYRAGLWGIFGFHADFVLEEARLMAQAGEAEAAIDLYGRYLRLRPQPPDLESWAETWHAARAEHERLTALASG